MRPNEHGRLWSEEMGLWVGTWEGTFQGITGTWVRFYHTDGTLSLTDAEAHRQVADDEKHRADELAAEVARLRALLEQRGSPPDQLN
jgi:hypothetical protein